MPPPDAAEDQSATPATAPATHLNREADAIPLPPDSAPEIAPDAAAPGAAAAPAMAGEVTEEQARAAAANHRPMMGMLVNGLADGLLPNWNITTDERDKLTETFSVALGYWWPDGAVPPKWAALIMAGYATYQVVNARRQNDGTWTPRKVIVVKRSAEATPTAATTLTPSKGKGDGAGVEVS